MATQLRPEEIQAITERILRGVPKQSRFEFPGGNDREGCIIDRVTRYSNTDSAGVHCWDTIDLIAFPDGKYIRFGYHHLNGHKLVFCQRPLSDPIPTLTKLFAKAVREKPWFRAMISRALADALALTPGE
jgi:hypothetical protein